MPADTMAERLPEVADIYSANVHLAWDVLDQTHHPRIFWTHMARRRVVRSMQRAGVGGRVWWFVAVGPGGAWMDVRGMAGPGADVYHERWRRGRTERRERL